MTPGYPQPKETLKVVIIGGATKPGALLERYGDSGWEFWGLNAMRPAWSTDIPWARWFNLHRYEHLVRDWADGLAKEIKWARANPTVPFYVLDDYEEWPIPCQRFPRREMAPSQPRSMYHAGSFDWLVAYAVHLGAIEISLHGVKLATDGPADEPISARACLEYWCGYAEGRGRKVTAAEDCNIFCQYHLVRSNSVYGYDDVQLVEERP